MDIYLYVDYDVMSNWMKELNEEYFNYNMVGEIWVIELVYIVWWQKDFKFFVLCNSYLKIVMDFSFFDKVNMVKNE